MRSTAPADPVTGPAETVDAAVRGLFSRDALYSLWWSAQMVSVAVVTPFATRVLGTVEFGRVATAIAALQVLFILASVGLPGAIERCYAADGPRAARTLLTVGVLAALTVTAGAEATSPWWGPAVGFGPDAVELHLAAGSAGLLAVVAFCQALLRSQDRLLPFGLVSVVLAGGATAAGLGLALATDRSAHAYLLGQLGAQVVAVVLALALCRPRPVGVRDGAMTRRAFRFGVPLVPVGLNAVVLAASDRLVVAETLGLVAVARYHIAYSVGALPLLAISLISWAWLPRLLTLNEDAERPLVLAASRDALYRLLVPVVLGLCVGAPLVLRLWSPASFAVDELLLTTALVVVTVVPYTAAIVVENAMLAAGRSMPIAVATTIAAGTNVALNLVLVPVAGLPGSALATLLSYVLLHALLLVGGRGGRLLAPGRHGPRLALAIAVVAGIATVAVPTTPALLVVRALAAALTVAWFVHVTLGVLRSGPRAEGVRT